MSEDYFQKQQRRRIFKNDLARFRTGAEIDWLDSQIAANRAATERAERRELATKELSSSQQALLDQLGKPPHKLLSAWTQSWRTELNRIDVASESVSVLAELQRLLTRIADYQRPLTEAGFTYWALWADPPPPSEPPEDSLLWPGHGRRARHSPIPQIRPNWSEPTLDFGFGGRAVLSYLASLTKSLESLVNARQQHETVFGV